MQAHFYYKSRGGVYAGEAFCVHERCCRRWRRALPKIQDGFEDSGTDEESGDDAFETPDDLDGAPQVWLKANPC